MAWRLVVDTPRNPPLHRNNFENINSQTARWIAVQAQYAPLEKFVGQPVARVNEWRIHHRSQINRYRRGSEKEEEMSSICRKTKNNYCKQTAHMLMTIRHVKPCASALGTYVQYIRFVITINNVNSLINQTAKTYLCYLQYFCRLKKNWNTKTEILMIYLYLIYDYLLRK